MNLLNKDFLEIHPNYFGSENISLFLYSLIKTTRPNKLLELGAGYSTFFMAQALKDIKNEIKNSSSPFSIKDQNWEKEYNPILEVYENESSPNTSISQIKNNLSKLNLEKYVSFKIKDYKDFTFNTEYNLIWWDAGANENLFTFFRKFLNILTEGGILIIHSTLTNLWGRFFLSELKLKIQSGDLKNLELISFLEPHKFEQNSFTIIKKTTTDPIFSIGS